MNFSDAKGKIRKGAKMLPATCGCGHAGKSQRPAHYRCTGCYNAGWAKYNRMLAAKHKAVAAKLLEDAEKHQAVSDAFRLKHNHKQ